PTNGGRGVRSQGSDHRGPNTGVRSQGSDHRGLITGVRSLGGPITGVRSQGSDHWGPITGVRSLGPTPPNHPRTLVSSKRDRLYKTKPMCPANDLHFAKY
uniref:Uncharacterized protein n=1 Tax=Scophthalmus maximus TaxID=52904 RepID=A0A8D3CHI7_SCOMX